jgi:hypothetical protein
MSKFGLWEIRWGGSEYESEMTFEGEKLSPSYKVVNAFKERGFDRVVFLDGEGKEINYTGDGHKDGASLALWISSRVSGLKYYVPIPFYKYGSNEPRDDPSDGFANSYWRDWIDGVLSVIDSDRLGFYWSYESCLQATSHDEHNVREEFIREMAEYIHNHNQEFIWIPTVGNRTMEQIKTFCAIPALANYFNYVFVQPHYYQTTKLSDGSDYSFQELVRRVKWMYENGFSIEMEADNSIIGEKSNCAYCKSTQNRGVVT